jgi:hypothetical protein
MQLGYVKYKIYGYIDCNGKQKTNMIRNAGESNEGKPKKNWDTENEERVTMMQCKYMELHPIQSFFFRDQWVNAKQTCARKFEDGYMEYATEDFGRVND